MTSTVVVSQLGARRHYAVPRILHEAGLLERLNTDICAARGWPRLLRALPPRILPQLLRRLAGRMPHGIAADRIRTFETIGLVAAAQRMAVPTRAQDTKAALQAARRLGRAVEREGFGDATGFYGFAGECLEQLQAARRNGLWTVVDQVNAPREIVDRLVAREAERFPGWEPEPEADPYGAAFAAREKAELWAADLVVCPSEFVRRSVAECGGPVERCVVVPFGVDARFRIPEREREPGPLRVLTVGAIGLRKGSPYVLEAARRLEGLATFRLVGPVLVSAAKQAELRTALDLAGPTPRAEIARHYAWADVFLLPSVCEGSAMVIYEALAAGLPVVTTPNAGSVVRDGIEGYVCPAGDADAICDRLEHLARDRELLETMARCAALRSKDYNLAGYGRRLLAALEAPKAGLRKIAREVA